MSINNEKVLIEMASSIRALSIDAIENANSGHPGMPMGMADIATILFSYFLKFDPDKPRWLDRDRFVLSAGHGSMLLYALSYLLGYKDCSLNQIKNFRQLGSKTAGHPEYGMLSSIETTTGPLGQGLANAVGMAVSEKLLNEKFGSLVDHKTWVIAGDGCLMEGISQEAISLAGHLKLNKLIVFFDDNNISIDGPTNLTCSDNQKKRFEASNWDTFEIDGHDFKQIFDSISKAIKSSKPSLIICKTIIGFGSPNKSGKETCHGSPLGKSESLLTKQNINWPHKKFFIPKHIKNYWQKVAFRNVKKRLKWENKLKNSKLKKKFLNQFKTFNIKRNSDTDYFLQNIVKSNNSEATRKSSQNCINYFYTQIPNLLGGSADLTGSNLTKVQSSVVGGKNSNYIHYGVREHLMAAAMNGISVHGGFIPYGGTFLVFSDYCRNSIRLSAMMKQRVVYVFTHDSIGLGEDGPTHQPIEHLTSLRSIPNLNVLRPCDQIETFEAWEIALNSTNTPSVLALSRQNLPLIRKDFKINRSMMGAYQLSTNKNSKLSIFASGSEVEIAVRISKILKDNDINSNVISVPCTRLFDTQSQLYKDKILSNLPRVFIEAGSSDTWYKYSDKNDLICGVNHFGESGKGNDVYAHFGLEDKQILKKIMVKFFK